MSEGVPRIRIPYYAEQAELVRLAVERGQLARGPHLEELAAQIAHRTGRRFVVLTANGFAALFTALKVLVPEPVNVVTTPASTCFAMVNAIIAAGHKPAFADMEVATASLSLPLGDQHGSQTLAVVPDHFGLIAAACRQPPSGVVIVEDAAQSFLSLGSTNSRAAVTILSLYPTKLFNGIDGGALLTDDSELFRRASRLVTYTDQRAWEPAPRYNLTLPNLHAAFALGTLPQLDALAARLCQIHRRLASALEARGLLAFAPGAGMVPSRLLVTAESEARRDAVLHHCLRCGVEASRELLPVCAPVELARFPVARRLVETTLSLPFHPLLNEEDLGQIETTIRRL